MSKLYNNPSKMTANNNHSAVELDNKASKLSTYQALARILKNVTPEEPLQFIKALKLDNITVEQALGYNDYDALVALYKIDEMKVSVVESEVIYEDHIINTTEPFIVY